MATVTTSIRMSADLKKRLDRTAKRLKKSRNEIVNELLAEYLSLYDKETLRARIREESRLIAEHDKTNPDVAYWDKVMALSMDELWK